MPQIPHTENGAISEDTSPDLGNGSAILSGVMQQRLLILNNAVHRHLFHPDRHWRPFLEGVDVCVVRLLGGQSPPPLDRFTHILVTGSEASVRTRSPWMDRECELIRSAVARGLPVLGSCFGFQILVSALSGSEYIRRSSSPEIGWITLHTVQQDSLFSGAPNSWTVFSFHVDEVVNPPPPWRVLATSQRKIVHMARYGDHPVWGIQAHPEISPRKAHVYTKLYLAAMKRTPVKVLGALRRPSGNPPVSIGSIVSGFLATPPATAPDNRGR